MDFIFIIPAGISFFVLSFAIMKGRLMKSYGKISIFIAFILFIIGMILIRTGLKYTKFF
jgi:hypothetical protein